MKSYTVALVLGMLFSIGCNKNEKTNPSDISAEEIASALGMHKFQIKIPDRLPENGMIGLALFDGENQIPIGGQTSIGNMSEVINFYIWSSNNPEVYNCKLDDLCFVVSNKIFATPATTYFTSDILNTNDFIFIKQDMNLRPSQYKNPPRCGVKVVVYDRNGPVCYSIPETL